MRQLRVAERAVILRLGHAERLGQLAQRVAFCVRHQDAGQFKCVQRLVGRQHFLAAQKAQVKGNVVAHHGQVAHKSRKARQHRPQRRRILRHLARDACQLNDLGGNRAAWVDQARKLVEDFVAAKFDRADFEDAIALRIEARGFQV